MQKKAVLAAVERGSANAFSEAKSLVRLVQLGTVSAAEALRLISISRAREDRLDRDFPGAVRFRREVREKFLKLLANDLEKGGAKNGRAGQSGVRFSPRARSTAG